jgi:hypothetical protein
LHTITGSPLLSPTSLPSNPPLHRAKKTISSQPYRISIHWTVFVCHPLYSMSSYPSSHASPPDFFVSPHAMDR